MPQSLCVRPGAFRRSTLERTSACLRPVQSELMPAFVMVNPFCIGRLLRRFSRPLSLTTRNNFWTSRSFNIVLTEETQRNAQCRSRRPVQLLIESCNKICHHGALMRPNLMEWWKSCPHDAIFSQNLIIAGSQDSSHAGAAKCSLSHPSHFRLRHTFDLRHNH